MYAFGSLLLNLGAAFTLEGIEYAMSFRQMTHKGEHGPERSLVLLIHSCCNFRE